ncbi:MAG: type II toxin-antitoxin system RatA family toxin [Kordiimonadaceae bacterium]|jgi:coenzyme Q-binding protein COQ10|nr:type II toxin-antitoxin system RatA family toxin [Kordiimonadaceae bacterium]MBT6036497.1 type II toxin-antitoxin system RatA family toxin [Kordiimonadaceae bacterium]MBT6330998.1 type II toxin-antitoxin system RatA family toxin [Kordiimonadaceae bacterium]MBT7581449.1 type II toxin-antitoxin system RatA family toxin [Kordiimonadaceae bacterium]
MPRFVEDRTFHYSAQQMYDLVADVKEYPNFLPWCIGSRLYNQTDNDFYADLIIGFKMFRERFTSHVILGDNQIDINYIRGPLSHLHNLWQFKDLEQGGSILHFEVDFEFKNKIFQKMVGGLFTEAVHRMVASFEIRAEELYGK